MKHRIQLSEIFTLMIMVFLAVMASSCADRQFEGLPDYTVSGQPVKLKVPLLLPKMDEKTRGSLSENQLNRVESLWIRTYNAETGLATSNWIKSKPKTSDLHNMREIEFEIDTQSGYTYIIAVANVSAKGVKSDDITNQKPLSELLEDADTWEKFLKIAVVSPSDEDDVNAPQGALPSDEDDVNASQGAVLPMAGCYSDYVTEGENAEHVALDKWQDKDFQPYFIPASSEKIEFKGGIHLRRLVSHITFNFKSGNDDMDLQVNSYQIMNAPKFSWLYERAATQTTAPNFGDLAVSAEKAKDYYADVPQFGSQFIRNVNGVQSFDFWQAENKHTGDCTTYAGRGKKTEKDGITLFTSLTGETWTTNNEATYVVVDCTMDYNKSIFVDKDGKIMNEGDAGAEKVNRSGNATYFIHLGYIMGSTKEERAKDFNCFRNVDYTYNVTVNGLNDIRVDAFATDSDPEIYHNEEGLVVDLQDKSIEIDAHYAVFNIQLTQKELGENFGFIITTYDNGEQITLSEKNQRKTENGAIVIYDDDGKPIPSKYYNWIELRPTTGENVLAEYKPRFNDINTADGKTFLLTDLYNVNGRLNLPEKCISETGYYTVFVNEYTYEPIFGEDGYGLETGEADDGRPNWMHYVNQNPRRFYIKVSYQESPDGNSVYARSKYAVEQKSLMTYYSQIHLDPDGTAIGVERENETFGLNLRHAQGSGGSSSTNGRWNAAQYLTTGLYEHHTVQEPWGSLSVNRQDDSEKSPWATFLEMSEPLEVPGVTNSLRLQGGPAIMERTIANGNPHKLRKIRQKPTSDNNDDSNLNYTTFTDPQGDPQYNIRAMSAFINRNRDNNGNGKIDAEELRWYIPAITRYIGMTLGENAMPQPLMEYSDVHQLPRVVNGNHFSFNQNEGNIDNLYYSRYMYIASNSQAENNVLWSMEGTSLSKYQEISDWTGISMNPWQIRCIRNLGSNLKTVVKDDKVTLPSRHNESAKTITMDYFNLAAIRTIQYTSNGTTNSGTSSIMPVHTINSPYNSVYAAFEYANEDILVPEEFKPQSESKFSDKFTEYINNNPCGNAGLSGSGWRVPNQIELTMMFNYHILTGWGAWLSCTVDYFDRADGTGSDATDNKLYMGATSGKTLLLSWYNYDVAVGKNVRVRCVRDVNP